MRARATSAASGRGAAVAGVPLAVARDVDDAVASIVREAPQRGAGPPSGAAERSLARLQHLRARVDMLETHSAACTEAWAAAIAREDARERLLRRERGVIDAALSYSRTLLAAAGDAAVCWLVAARRNLADYAVDLAAVEDVRELRQPGALGVSSRIGWWAWHVHATAGAPPARHALIARLVSALSAREGHWCRTMGASDAAVAALKSKCDELAARDAAMAASVRSGAHRHVARRVLRLSPARAFCD